MNNVETFKNYDKELQDLIHNSICIKSILIMECQKIKYSKEYKKDFLLCLIISILISNNDLKYKLNYYGLTLEKISKYLQININYVINNINYYNIHVYNYISEETNRILNQANDYLNQNEKISLNDIINSVYIKNDSALKKVLSDLNINESVDLFSEEMVKKIKKNKKSIVF